MSIEEMMKLVNKIEKDQYIDCSGVIYDNDQFKKILAGLKQNIELQNVNKEITTKLETVENEAAGSLLEIERLNKEQSDLANQGYKFMQETRKFINELYSGTEMNDIRIGDYIFHKQNNGIVVYKYEPIVEPEPIALQINVIENDKNEKCPICKGDLGKYPAISRADNKTKICSNCGMLEAIKIWYEHEGA